MVRQAEESKRVALREGLGGQQLDYHIDRHNESQFDAACKE